ncbi:MAG: tRNA 2-thiouridine(34) synthase MnmA [Deltaproteobacteria bacterium]|nr:tRNA 2-thiouridine(34) synthase MnmA [Deltaproteobacteria bacterium]
MKSITKVFVAMSGGVDSSIAAALLKERGYEVVGVHMVCWDDCDLWKERLDALRVALKLDIPFLTFDFRKEYKKHVFDYMVREYSEGRTPNPDVMCNREIKFGIFLEKALSLGGDFIATGHYARLHSTAQGQELLEGIDKQKDQSYFLWTSNERQLKYCLFPLGDYTKPQVREMARRLKLPTAEKKDSQGLCFVGKMNFSYFLRDFLARREGAIVTSKGAFVGQHDGVAFYTIGQRHGLGIGGGVPYYVADKDVANNTLVVGEGPDDPILFKKEICVDNLNWLSDFREGRCEVRIRYRQPRVPALVVKQANQVRVLLDVPERGVAPGQSAVFYHQEKVLGGGIIYSPAQ